MLRIEIPIFEFSVNAILHERRFLVFNLYSEGSIDFDTRPFDAKRIYFEKGINQYGD